MIEAPKHAVTHPDRHLGCQEALELDLLEIIDRSNMRGWGTVETMDAIEEVMKHLRIAYAEDPNPGEEPVVDARLFLHKHPADGG